MPGSAKWGLGNPPQSRSRLAGSPGTSAERVFALLDSPAPTAVPAAGVELKLREVAAVGLGGHEVKISLRFSVWVFLFTMSV